MKNLNVDGGWETSLMQVKGWHELQRYFFSPFFSRVTITIIRPGNIFLTNCNSTGVMVCPESSPAYSAGGPLETQRAPVEAVDDGVPPVSQTLCKLMILP